jgi:hypothetical protein
MTARTIFFTVMAAFLVAMTIAMVFVFLAAAASAQEHRHGGGGGGWHGGRPTPTWGSGRGGGGQRHYYSGRQPGYRYEPGRGWFNPSAAIGGALGGWLWRQWAQPEPPVVVVQPEDKYYGPDTVQWCINRYKSYDPYTRTYLGYDGLRHGCP